VESNPIATEEQREHELSALELVKHPVEMRACFDAAFEEVMFSAAIWSLNQDPLRPKVTTITRIEHEIDAVRVPGSRWGLDNPDSIYRIIPISGSERYRIHGKVAAHRLTENYFTLWKKNFDTVDVLDGSKLALEPDGSFVIEVDSDPAGGRANHVRSAPEAHEFYIRDVVMDWATETPNELRIERLGDAPAVPPRSEEEQAQLTAEFMLHYADSTLRWNAQWLEKPANTLQFTIDRDTDGALRNQIYILGHFQLGDDDALLIHVSTGGARYFIAPITNAWGTTNGIMDRTGSLNLAQSVPNPDGTYTFVVSVADPGAHNWLDPSDMHEGILTLRWAEFEGGKPGPDTGATSELVPLSELRARLPEGTRFVTPHERKTQLQERATAYARRLQES
jgi:hypothetical protein